MLAESFSRSYYMGGYYIIWVALIVMTNEFIQTTGSTGGQIILSSSSGFLLH